MNRLYEKYRITKADGSPCDEKAQYFVLRLDTDPAARAAATTYANCIRKDNPDFANDIYLWVERLTQDAHPDQADKS
jgi:hypothetical protein